MLFLKLGALSGALFFALSAVAAAQDIGTKAMSRIVDASGEEIGIATYTQGNEGLIMEVQVRGLPAGARGMHFHAVGACDGDADFKSAKGHIMPTGRPHGFFHADGPHAGNLPNLIVAEDGTAHVELYTSLVSINGRGGKPALLDEDGSTLIIHANRDDHETQPIGGAGGRIACGLVEPVAD